MTIVKELDALHVNGEEYKFPAGEGDMKYSDFSLVTKSGATITLDLFSEIEPSENFTINAPSEIKEGQMYILRVTTGATPYTMTLGTGITNPYNESTTLTANTVHQFGFLAVDGNLELQPSVTQSGGGTWGTITGTLSDQTDLQTALNAKADASDLNTKTFILSSTSDLTNAQAAYDWYAAGKNPIIMYNGTAYIVTPNDGFPQALNFSPASLYTNRDSSKTMSGILSLQIFHSGDTVTSIQTGAAGINILETDRNYSTPYTPRYNGSPATKKYVDDNIIQKSAVEPSNPTEGTVWYDTTNDVLKVYNGSNWNVTGKTYTAGDRITITNNEISADKQFEVVDTLPDIAQASADKVYILGPLNVDGADKYEEYIVKEVIGFISSSPVSKVTWDWIVGEYSDKYQGSERGFTNKYIGVNNLYQEDISADIGVINIYDYNSSTEEQTPIAEHLTSSDMPYTYSTDALADPVVVATDSAFSSDINGSLDIYFSDSPMTWGTSKEWIKIGETSADLSNYLAKNNTTSYTPSGNYNPATKKYVDDRAVPTSGTTGYVLTKTANGYEWAAAPSSGKNDIIVSGAAPSDHTVLWLYDDPKGCEDSELRFYNPKLGEWTPFVGTYAGSSAPDSYNALWYNTNEREFYIYNNDDSGWQPVGGVISGDSAPSSGNKLWYDTDEDHELKFYENQNGTWIPFWGIINKDYVRNPIPGNFFATDSSNRTFYYESGFGWTPIGGIIYADSSTNVPTDKLWYDENNDVFKYYNNSTDAWEEVTKIYTAGDGIDIDANNNNAISVDVTDIIGTGLSEDANNNIIVDTTVVATQTDLSGKQDKATSGSTAPSTTPTYVGQQYVDTTNNKLYVATGTTSSSDWTEVGSGGSGGGGNVIAMTQAEYNALTTEEKNDGKLRIITDAPTEDISVDWSNVANKKVDLSTQTGNLSELKFWIGTTKAYQNLDSYDNNTVYICKKVIS